MGKIVGLVFPVNTSEPELNDSVPQEELPTAGAPEGAGAENPKSVADSEPLICPECGKVYKTVDGLQKHIAEKHHT